ncbi:1-acyl-sn-glycerol-3-phosphate acyltransferase [Candidatus Synchoanobacter obligatus]|uniref:1-acyl-sn-glycerol-3-phosphate acyltransferase n=1 Tax=Candidatus Synchoanobacter obligatus TaxID=2919597 RepID=A0ABT1L4M7_9GAMM|nr:1-acyl-sn-glycerol-3-phosphate acyltransferase [Candidatus Synchoanobacter obligatus]MCP8352120.1 1-acyl-sn-glycerol-3-phosphate acyltransferase [Candidatus Synchoanobacter obligatus]
MLMSIGLIIWLLVSLVTMGTVCFIVAMLYWAFPNAFLHKVMWLLYTSWVMMLQWWVKRLVPIEEIFDNSMPKNRHYVVIANHYSWLDILVLYATVFSPERAFVFVMKRSLIRIPMIGLVCWGLGHPLLYRGRSRRKNLKVLKEAVQKAKDYGYGMLIFPEGTRYTKVEKVSDYRNLLNPKTVGFEYIIKQFESDVPVVDVTLDYAKGTHGIWDFLMGRIGPTKVYASVSSVAVDHAKEFILAKWQQKDALLDQ